MKPIETIYNGFRFRSRLEARWAVFFDYLGIEYLYEPEGFETTFSLIEGSEQVVRYLPDFFLPKIETWVEVKGVLASNDPIKMGIIMDFTSPMPHIEHSFYSDTHGLLVLGDIPKKSTVVFHKIVSHYKGIHVQHACFYQKKLGEYSIMKKTFPGDESKQSEGHDCTDEVFCPDDILINHNIEEYIYRSYNVEKAYQAARMARFEYGE